MRIEKRGRVLSLLARAWHDRRGVVAVMLAVLLPVVIGAVELGVEPGVWYAIVRQDQSAADAAAITAAFEVAAGLEAGSGTPVSAQVTAAAARDAARNGFNTTSNTPTILCPPTTAAPAGMSWPASCSLPTSSNAQGAAVEVVLAQQEESALLPSVLSSLTLGARAVAQLTTKASACALALGTTQTVIQVSAALNLAETSADTCALAANSTDPASIALVNGSNAITASTMWSAGNYTLASGAAAPTLAQTATINSFALQDPYAGTTVGSVPSGPCQTWSSATANNVPPAPGVLYCSISFAPPTNCSAGGSWSLPPGVYYLDGGNFSIDGSGCGTTVTGTGVTIVLTAVTQPYAGTIDIVGGKVNLSAPLAGSGTFPGILFLQDPATANPALSNTIGPVSASAASLILNGLIYTPAAPITFNVAGNAAAATCTAVIAQSIVFSGLTTKLTNANCANYGVNLAPIISVVLAE